MNNPNCPGCGKPLQKVKQSANSMLNAEQFDAARAGDWFCSTCPGNNQARTGYRYFWEKDLAAWGRDMIAPQAASQQAGPVAMITGSDTVIGRESRGLHWVKGVNAFDYEPGTKLYAAPQAATTASASDQGDADEQPVR